MNETLIAILEIPLFWRAAITLFALWLVYMFASRLIFKLISFIPAIFNWLWVFVYRMFNNMAHGLHKAGGKALVGVDQAVTDFFGSVYGFFENIKTTINNCCRVKAADKDGKRQVDRDGKQKYTDTPKKPFVGAAFLVAMIFTVWIAAPTWLNAEDGSNAFTSAYHKYIEIEGLVLEMVFGGN